MKPIITSIVMALGALTAVPGQAADIVYGQQTYAPRQGSLKDPPAKQPAEDEEIDETAIIIGGVLITGAAAAAFIAADGDKDKERPASP